MFLEQEACAQRDCRCQGPPILQVHFLLHRCTCDMRVLNTLRILTMACLWDRFMTPDSLWVMTDRMWEENFFAPAPAATLPPAAKLKQTEAAFKDVSALEKKLKKKSLTKSKSKKVDKSKKDGSVKLTAAAEDDDETQQDNAAEDDAAEEAEDDEPPSVPSGDGEGDVAEAED